MSGQDEGDGFLRRWSRLKSDSAPAETAPAEDNAVAPGEEPETEAAEAEPDEAAIADLPDIETLDKDSDYTVFMRDGVPEALRQRALRKLWLSDPVLANLDGLNDYDDDFAAILREGATYMQKLVDAGERLTRPGSEDDYKEEAAEAEPATETSAEEGDGEEPAGDTESAARRGDEPAA